MGVPVDHLESAPRSGASRRWLARSSGGIGRYAILIVAMLVFLVPIIWIWFASLKTSKEIAQDPFGLPEDWHWENLKKAWTVGHFDRYMGNTAIYCAAIVSGVVVLSCLAGYALALLPIPFRGGILMIFILGLMVPFQSVMIPI